MPTETILLCCQCIPAVEAQQPVLQGRSAGPCSGSLGKSCGASFQSTGLGKADRLPARLCSSASVRRAAVPMETYTAPCPAASPCSTKAPRSAGSALAEFALMGPTNCRTKSNDQQNDTLFDHHAYDHHHHYLSCNVCCNTRSARTQEVLDSCGLRTHNLKQGSCAKVACKACA